jgi:hypothetical protein
MELESFKNKSVVIYKEVGRVAQSVLQLAKGWTVRGSNPGGDEIFRTCPDRPGREADPLPPSSAVLKKG